MPAKSPEAIERRRTNYNAARRAARAADPKVTTRETKERRERLAKDKPAQARRVLALQLREQRITETRERRETKRLIERQARDARPFVGCDGEGYTAADGDRYALFRMGERELFRPGEDGRGERLTTHELLKFITDHPEPEASEILVAFAFEYDINNILRDLSPERWKQLRKVDQAGLDGETNTFKQGGGWTWVHYGRESYGLQYIPRNHLMVCRGQIGWDVRNQTWRAFAIKGSVRTIYDTFGFFQSSFLKALERWEVGADYRAFVATLKSERGTFTGMTEDVRRYCAIECDLLGDMMGAFRAACLAADIRPRTWNGAGKIATALLNAREAITSKQLAQLVPASLLQMSREAYYGGRFEVTRIGHIRRPVHALDIRSAYPAAMLKLPCLVHGAWIKASGAELVKRLADPAQLFVAALTFHHPHGPDGQFLCGLPVRSIKDGRLSWPRLGRGTYWSTEIRSAIALGASVQLFAGWRYEKRCDCCPYEWVESLYEYRRSIGSGGRGIPLKLGINSLYGKMAQRIGNPKYANPLYASLVTATTRATLNDAIVKAGQRNVVMIATDAVYTIGRKPKLPIGERLGQWEHKVYPSLFIVRPGLYWAAHKRRGDTSAWAVKSRGLRAANLIKVIPQLRSVWLDYWRRRKQLNVLGWMAARRPVVAMPVRMFCSMRLAAHIKRPQDACQWVDRTIDIRFECSSIAKRAPGSAVWDDMAIVLGPNTGDDRFRSATYDEAGKLTANIADMIEDRMWAEAQPDPVEQLPDDE